MQLKPRNAFFRNPVLSFSAVASPHPAKWIALSISSPVLWVQWNVPLPLRSAVRVAGDARPVARESPGRDGFARPRAAPPPPRAPSVIPLRALLVPLSPYPVDYRLGTSKQLAERSLQTQTRWEFPLSVCPGPLFPGLCRSQSSEWPR